MLRRSLATEKGNIPGMAIIRKYLHSCTSDLIVFKMHAAADWLANRKAPRRIYPLLVRAGYKGEWSDMWMQIVDVQPPYNLSDPPPPTEPHGPKVAIRGIGQTKKPGSRSNTH